MSYFTLMAMESSKKWNYFIEDIILLDYLQSNATISTTFQKHPQKGDQQSNGVTSFMESLKLKGRPRYD